MPIDYCLEPEEMEADRHRFPVLKLHGSLNWGQCGDPGCARVNPRSIGGEMSRKTWPAGYATYRFTSLLTGNCSCGKPLATDPVIVPPTWNKGAHYEQIRNVWRRAAHHLGDAENVFVIGFSLPPTDQFFRYLYGLGTVGPALLRRFWVFDPNQSEASSRFGKLLGAPVSHRLNVQPMRFSDVISRLRSSLEVADNDDARRRRQEFRQAYAAMD